jgi:hypothetical protein
MTLCAPNERGTYQAHGFRKLGANGRSARLSLLNQQKLIIPLISYTIRLPYMYVTQKPLD